MTLSFLILPWIVLLSVPPPLSAPRSESFEYDVIASGDTIGSMTVTRTIRGNKTEYRSVNNSQKRIIKLFELDHELSAHYLDDQLVESEVTVMLNGNLRNHTRITYHDGTYQVFEEEEQKETITQPIHFTAVQLYFREPIGVDAIFSEQFATWHTIEPVEGSPHVYELHKKGKSTIYHYQNGLVVYAELGTRLISTEIRIKE